MDQCRTIIEHLRKSPRGSSTSREVSNELGIEHKLVLKWLRIFHDYDLVKLLPYVTTEDPGKKDFIIKSEIHAEDVIDWCDEYLEDKDEVRDSGQTIVIEGPNYGVIGQSGSSSSLDQSRAISIDKKTPEATPSIRGILSKYWWYLVIPVAAGLIIYWLSSWLMPK